VRTIALLLALSQAPANPLLAPALCVRRYLEAVRRGTPYPPAGRATPPQPREASYDAAKRLTAPRALEEIAARAARGAPHPLAPWGAGGRDGFVQAFELVGVRRAPRGAAVVSVREHLYRFAAGGAALAPVLTEYLVAPVDGAWRVVDRRPGGRFTDGEIAEGYERWWDAPPAAGARDR
jgi:hypothetical protein